MADEIKLYGGAQLFWTKETPGTNVYSADVNGRKQTQYVPKSDASKREFVIIKAELGPEA